MKTIRSEAMRKGRAGGRMNLSVFANMGEIV